MPRVGESETEEVTPYQFLPPLSVVEMEALRSDIKSRGVQVPVEVDENGHILDGHHRIQVCRELGITNYPRVVRAGMTEDQKQEHALRLNLSRRHITRAQRREVVAMLRGRGWSLRRIAAATGVSAPTVLEDLRSSGVQDLTPDEGTESVVVGADGKSYPARKRTSVVVSTDYQQRAAQEALLALGDESPGRMTDLRRLDRLRRDQRARVAREAVHNNAVALPTGVDLRHCSVADLEVEPGSVDMVLTDPPYTIAALNEGVWRDLGAFAGKALRPGGLLVAMSGSLYLPQVLGDLSESSMLEWWWMLSVPFANHPRHVRQRGIASAFRPVLVYRQPGGHQHPAWTLDVITGGGRDKEHHSSWGQSPVEFATILDVWTQPGDLVVDPFLGGGATAQAAQTVGGRRYIGCDINADWVDTTRARLSEWTQNRHEQTGSTVSP